MLYVMEIQDDKHPNFSLVAKVYDHLKAITLQDPNLSAVAQTMTVPDFQDYALRRIDYSGPEPTEEYKSVLWRLT